jgi:ribonucleoside-diphosphate reductase alpha chain
MSIRALQDYTYYSKYARYNESEKRRETWNEACDRVKEMHLRRYPQVKDEIEWAFNLSKDVRVLGSQRALQFGGTPIEKKNARIYNCTVSFCDRIRFFQECFWLLLCGCGTGFSVQNHHIAKLPDFYPDMVKAFKTPPLGDVPVAEHANLKRRIFTIPDTIEGWADALGVLMATYMPNPEFPDWEGCFVEFDFSAIRPKGSYLSSGVGKAPGSGPLREALRIIQNMLNERIIQGFDRLRTIDAYDIVMHASDAVLSGGVRRSATICIFSPDDEDMVLAKTGNWFVENPQRGRSNNSALLLRDKTSKEQFVKLMSAVKQFGEPGFYWSDSTEQLPNPCVEIGMWPVDEVTGESGWQFCNLCEINGKKIRCKEDFAIAARAAAIIGTLQAGYSSFDYLGPVTEAIVRREALLGVSMTGMQDSPDITFNPSIQRQMAKLVVETNEWMAKKIGINPAARCTCIKPAGTTSCMLGSASGVHPHHARRYFRRVQANALESVYQYFKEHNPVAIESSVYRETDGVITFCIEVPDGAKTKNDIAAIELLKCVKTTYQNWVEYGKQKDLCTQEWLTHNVSNTINVRPDEWDKVTDFIYKNRNFFSGIALLPQSGDLDYPQAPMLNVHTPREIFQRYGDGSLMASGLIVDGLHAFDGNLWNACNAVLGLGDPIELPEEPTSSNIDDFRAYESEVQKCKKQLDWIRRVEQFAERYCDKDVRKCSYLLKEVNNWKLWLDLKREYVDVDYTQLIEEEDFTKPMDTIACAGGACEIM